MNAEVIWMNGKLLPFKEANIHVLSHVIHYGSGIFEGIRAYHIDGKATVFRLNEHVDRLYEGMKVYRMECPYTKEEFKKGILDTIKANNLDSAYIRPIVYRGFNTLGVNPKNCPVDVSISAWEWGAYLGENALDNGIKAMVSSWNRLAPNTVPAMVKASGNYLSSQLIKMEALELGFDEGIGLDHNGNLSEGSGENLFIVKNNVVYTPGMASSVLSGITKDTIKSICIKLNIPFVEQTLSREFLYMSDEIFFSGTAAEVTGVTQIDHLQIADGKVGEITKQIQHEFFNIVNGKVTYDEDWLTVVE